jgi:outer membrane lipoprotein SlyB
LKWFYKKKSVFERSVLKNKNKLVSIESFPIFKITTPHSVVGDSVGGTVGCTVGCTVGGTVGDTVGGTVVATVGGTVVGGKQ